MRYQKMVTLRGHLRTRFSVLSALASIELAVVIVQTIDFSSADLPPFVKSQEPPECKSTCSISIRNSSLIDEPIDCDFVKDTYECEKRTRTLAFDDSTTDPPFRFEDLTNQSCQLDRVRVTLTPYAFDHPLYEVTLSLNISLTILDRSTRAVAVRLICVESGFEKEFYCVSRTRPSHWDRFYWPCRLFDFSNVQQSDSVVFPLHFHNDCFRLSALSQFLINVTLYPQNCVASYFFRMPSIPNVLAKDVTRWLPLVAVDANAEDGVWVNFSSPPSSIRVRRTAVELYEVLPNDPNLEDGNSERMGVRTILRRRGTVSSPDTGIFFADVPKAAYSAVVYAEHSSCESEKCLPMQVPFNLTKDHYTQFTQRQMDDKTRLASAWVPVTAAVVGIIVAFLVIAVTVVVCVRRKAAKRKRRLLAAVNFVQFVKRPVVLILYTNDFAQHRRCVLELATYLQSRANCDVELDEWVLTSTANGYWTPAEWLMHALQRADYYLIVFSAGAKETVFRPVDSSSFVELRPERPWDETFAPAMNFVLQRILQTARTVDARVISRDSTASGRARSAAAFDRYVCLYFSYSPVESVPDLFRTLVCPKFQLPDELRRLICHLHEFPHDTVYEHCPMDADRLCSSIAESSRFIETNPNWLQSRLVERAAGEMTAPGLNERQKINAISAAIDRLQGPAANVVPENLEEFYAGVLREQNRDLESQGLGIGDNGDKYPLVPPSTSAQEAENDSRFELLPPDDDELASLFYSSTSANRSQEHA